MAESRLRLRPAVEPGWGPRMAGDVCRPLGALGALGVLVLFVGGDLLDSARRLPWLRAIFQISSAGVVAGVGRYERRRYSG